MSKLLAKCDRGICLLLSLFLGGVLSFFLLLKFLGGWWKSDLLWALSPGWRIFPFGHADLGAMLLGTTINAIFYALPIYFVIRLTVWLSVKLRRG
jgi:hypothetical protein